MSTLWLYVRIQLMTFVCGIVGPIFLSVYFAAQPDPTLRWMYWWGLFITAADILIALTITRWCARTANSRSGRQPGRCRRSTADRHGITGYPPRPSRPGPARTWPCRWSLR
jgi:hypothetical protein